MSKRLRIITLVILALALAIFGTAMAQEEIGPCEGEVSGIVVNVDGSTVTILQTDGSLCTLEVDETTATHPIAVLLGRFFGDVSVEELTAALAFTRVCVVQDGDTWVLADCEQEGAVEAVIIMDNGDGTFQAMVEGQEELITVQGPEDADQLEALQKALMTLTVDWEVEDGKLVQVSEEIEALHAEGFGFGVLVKLFAIAAESEGEVTVEELLEAFASGTGIGELFQEFGKPSIVGVGHVIQAEKWEGGGPPGPPPHAKAFGLMKKNGGDQEQEDNDEELENNNQEQANTNNPGATVQSGNNGNGNGVCNAPGNNGKGLAKGKEKANCP